MRYCRICLATDCPISCSPSLNEIYSQLVDVLGEDYKLYVCYECNYLLVKFYKFRFKCITALNVLSSIDTDHSKISTKSVKDIDRQYYNLQSNLNCSSIVYDVVMSPTQAPNVKNEPIDQEEDTDMKIDIDIEEFEDDNIGIMDKDPQKTNDDIIEKITGNIDDHKIINLNTQNAETETNYTEYHKIVQSETLNDGKTIIDHNEKNTIESIKNANNEVQLKRICIPTSSATKECKPVSKKSKKVSISRAYKNGLSKIGRRDFIIKRNCIDDGSSYLEKLKNHVTFEALTPIEARNEMLSKKQAMIYRYNPVHRCELCYKRFLKESNLNNHMKRHNPMIGNQKCEFCSQYYRQLDKLKAHISSCHKYRMKCKNCDYVCHNMYQAKRHVAMHKGETFDREPCGKKYNDQPSTSQRPSVPRQQDPEPSTSQWPSVPRQQDPEHKPQAVEVLENVDIEMVDLRDVELDNAPAAQAALARKPSTSRLLFISPNVTPTDLCMPNSYQDKATAEQDAAADVELDSDDVEPHDLSGVPTFDELRIVLDRNEGSDFGEDVEEDEEQQRYTEYGAGDKSGVASNYTADFPDGAFPEDVEVLRAIDLRDDLYLRNLTTEEKLFDWREDPNVFKGTKEVFTGRAGPSFELEEDITPLALLEKIWDSDIIKLIVGQTNLYAEQSLKKPGVKLNSRKKDWKPVTANDIWLFFAVFILQSLDSRGDETDYWYSNLEYLDMPNFKKVMPYKKYVLIKKFLHFVNNETLIPSFDKSAKIKPIIDHLNKKFEGLYLPAQEITIDESLLLWKGRLNMVQKISNKAAGVGIKTYELCESKTGYLWSFRLYTGKDDKPTNADSTREAGSIEHSSNEHVLKVPEPDPNDPTKADEPDSKTSSIVFDLVRPLLGKGHVLYMDNFFNSPLLSRLLKIQNTDTVGTLRKNREFVPDSLKQTEKSDLRVGEIAFSVTNDITVTLWRDSNLVALISTMHPIKIGGKEKFGKYKYKPQVVLDYNLHMGGVDKKDQLMSAFPMERSRNLFWYKKVFRRLVNTSILNSWIIMNTKKKMAHRVFREQLVKLIVQKTQPPVSTVVNVNPKAMRPQLVGGHYSVKGTKKRAVCKLCTVRGIQDKRTSRMCDVCNIPLCLDPCFKEYHTKV